MSYQNVIVEKKELTLEVTLNRPPIKNAFNDELILELTDVFTQSATDENLRLAVITGAGDAFCSGGDIDWMKKSAAGDAKGLAQMLTTINRFPHPVITGVHGVCFGGGLGLVAVSDYVIVSSDALFSFSEVKLGLIPAVIGPFVLNKIGESHTRSLFLTAERFSSARAFGIGLVHRVVENREKMIGALAEAEKNILSLSPHAVKTAKKFIQEIKALSFPEQLNLAARTLTDLRASPEGQEGLTAFLEKRKPKWTT